MAVIHKRKADIWTACGEVQVFGKDDTAKVG